ncbi:MAG TPA: helix-turn-helix domain-containing protein [Terriglobales bacterium]|nr:helix-turn-helix domain-containing protein [Terriglobales bacterium]
MATDSAKATRFPLLETLLVHKGIAMNGTFTVRQVADLFGVSVRAIQDRVKRGQLTPRNLPGHAKFLPVDLETYLANSSIRRSPSS